MGFWDNFFKSKKNNNSVIATTSNEANLITNNLNKNESIVYKIPENLDLNFFLQIEDGSSANIFLNLDLQILFDKENKSFDYSAFDIEFNDVILITEIANDSQIKSFCLTDKIKHWIILSQKLTSDEMKVVFDLIFKKNRVEIPLENAIKEKALNILRKDFIKSFSFVDNGCDIKIDNWQIQQDVLLVLFKKISNFVYPRVQNFFPQGILALHDNEGQERNDIITKLRNKVICDLSLFSMMICLRETDDVFQNLYDGNLSEFISYFNRIQDFYTGFGLLSIDDNFINYVQKLIQCKESVISNDDLPDDLNFIAPSHSKYPNSTQDLFFENNENDSLNNFNITDLSAITSSSGYGSNQMSSPSSLISLDEIISSQQTKQIMITNHQEFIDYLNSLDVKSDKENQPPTSDTFNVINFLKKTISPNQQ